MESSMLEASVPFDKLRCNKCKNYLSYFPIYTSSTNENICGRCFWTSQDTHLRNEAYEIVSQFLNFPCRYKENGCCEEMVPKDIPKHEEDCLYKTVKCPISTCTWEKSLPETLRHCQTTHSDIMVKEEEFQINLSNSQQENLIEYEDTLYIALSSFSETENSLTFAVCHVNGESNLKNSDCHLVIKNGKRKLSIEVNVSDFTNPNYTKIYIHNFIKNESNNVTASKLFARLFFEDRNFKNRKSDNDMLSTIICSLCMYYAIPPIYHCVRKPSLLICSECISKHVDQSINCAIDKNKSSDPNLDKIASCLNFPCKYQDKGCTFTSKPDQIKKHFAQCLYRQFHCPLDEFMKCDWTGFAKDVSSHLLTSHQNMIFTERTFLFPIPAVRQLKTQKPVSTTSSIRRRRFIQSHRFNPDMHCKIIKLADFLFRLTFTKIEEKFCWELQLIDFSNKQFTYDIEVIDIQKDRSISKKQLCSQIGPKEELFQNEDCYCCFEKNQIEKFISEQQLRFKVNICKKIKNREV